MPVKPARADLPLTYSTPQAWADGVLADPLALLNDHAHLEKKAANNALELLSRWPEPNPPEHWVQAMTNAENNKGSASSRNNRRFTESSLPPALASHHTEARSISRG